MTEVILLDEGGLVTARRWCWVQSRETLAVPDTLAAILTAEVQPISCKEEVTVAVMDLLGLLEEYVGGEFLSAVLGVGQPEIS